MTKDQAFERCRKKAVGVYNDQLAELIQQANIQMGGDETRVIYLDKNHPPNEQGLWISQFIDSHMS